MANYNDLKTAIQQVIRTNGNEEITGAILQQSLLSMINSLGAGYQFIGVATPATSPGTPDQKVFYLASPGTYVNFSSFVVNINEIGIFKYDSQWSFETISLQAFDLLKATMVGIKPGKNIYNADNDLIGKFIQPNGSFNTNVNYHISGYIPVEQGQYNLSRLYYGSYVAIGAPQNNVNLYSSNLELISTVNLGNSQQLTIPSGVAYIRATINYANTNQFQIERGSSRTEYEPYNPIENYPAKIADGAVTTAKIADGAVTIDKTKEIFETILGNNLLNKNADGVAFGKFINANGNLSQSSTYNTTDFIPVTPGETYYFTSNNHQGTYARFVLFFNTNKEAISTAYYSNVYGTGIAAPQDAAYVRASYTNETYSIDSWLYSQISTSYIPYEEYNEEKRLISSFIGKKTITTEKIADGAVTAEKLSWTLPVNPRKFSSIFLGDSTIAPNSAIYTDVVHVLKNTLIAAHIKGTITDVRIGVGYYPEETTKRGYLSYWLKITPINVEVWRTDDVSAFETKAHGLTLTDETNIYISTGNNADYTHVKVSIISVSGDRYDATLPAWFGCGRAFIENMNSGSINGRISFMPKDITKRIWMFGDSYFSFGSNNRWTYYLLSDSFNSFLLNHKGGQAADGALTDLQNLLATGYKPSYIVWCLGMNGGGDTYDSATQSWVINAQQKNWLDSFIAICNTNHITPILATIPSVPNINHKGLSNYVKSLGYRYIDFDDAVGSNDVGQWYNGLLSNDNVHPNNNGAKVLYGRAISDFPEMTLFE